MRYCNTCNHVKHGNFCSECGAKLSKTDKYHNGIITVNFKPLEIDAYKDGNNNYFTTGGVDLHIPSHREIPKYLSCKFKQDHSGKLQFVDATYGSKYSRHYTPYLLVTKKGN